MKESLEIDEIIRNGSENEYIDFKAKQYVCSEDLLKDVLSMANSQSVTTKFIILGVKLTTSNDREFVGFRKDEIKEKSEYQQFIHSNIEPFINIDYFPYQFENSLLTIIEISNTCDKPYMLKKPYRNLNQGLCYIRKGSHQEHATRSDFDNFYNQKEGIDISIRDYCLLVTGDSGLGSCTILLRNHSNNPTTIMDGRLELSNNLGEVLSIHKLYGFEKEHKGIFSLELKNKTELLGDGLFGFESSDCFRLNVGSDGFSDNQFTAKLIMTDSNGISYSSIYENFSVIVRGKSLWKVEMKEKQSQKKSFK